MTKAFILSAALFATVSAFCQTGNASATTDTANAYAVLYCSCLDWHSRASAALKEQFIESAKENPQQRATLARAYQRLSAGIDSGTAAALKYLEAEYSDAETITKYYAERDRNMKLYADLEKMRRQYDARKANCVFPLRRKVKELEAEIELLLKY